MPNKWEEREDLHPLPPDIRAAFGRYPRPQAGAEFDSRFWRELSSRQKRYKGFIGFWRRLIEVEIEGIAVWRLGVSTCAGAGLCALVFAVLSWSVVPKTVPSASVVVALSPDASPSAPRFARGWWDEDYPLPRSPLRPPLGSGPSNPSLPTTSRRQSALPEKSCVPFARALA